MYCKAQKGGNCPYINIFVAQSLCQFHAITKRDDNKICDYQSNEKDGKVYELL